MQMHAVLIAQCNTENIPMTVSHSKASTVNFADKNANIASSKLHNM